MKITFLGTSHGVPARGRNCSGAMLEVGEAIYFIDAGAPLIEEFLKIRTEEDLKKARMLFLTHSHGDHIFGATNFVGLMNWFYKLPFGVYFPHKLVLDAFDNFYGAAGGRTTGLDRDLIKLLVIDPSVAYEDENIKVTFLPTAHMTKEAPTYAILVEAEGKRVLFSGDFSYRLRENDVPKIVTDEHLDLFVCEMAHFSLVELGPILDKCKSDRVYFTHIWPPVKFDEIRDAAPKYPFDMRTLDDGDVVEI